VASAAASCPAAVSSSRGVDRASDATDVEGHVDHGHRGGPVDPLSVAATDGRLAGTVRSAGDTPGAPGYQLGVPAEKFNDDRLERTLDAISQHTRDIWQDVVHQALLRADIDLSVIFYDLTAFVLHGSYADSQHVDFGFAHNTPLDKRKFKVGLDVSADGNIPTEYALWAGRTADMATVQENMERLCRLLRSHGRSVQETVIIGDRANLNAELALAYDDHGLRYLAGLQPQKKAHRELLVRYPDEQFYAQPLNAERGREGYWGRPCQVIFKHGGRQVTHRGLVILSGPMRSALRKGRATRLRALRRELEQVRARIGKPYYRTVEAVQKRADTRIKKSPVGKFVQAQAYTDEQGRIRLHWWVDRMPSCRRCAKTVATFWSPMTGSSRRSACSTSTAGRMAWRNASRSPRVT